jgi:hypothetical protein
MAIAAAIVLGYGLEEKAARMPACASTCTPHPRSGLRPVVVDTVRMFRPLSAVGVFQDGKRQGCVPVSSAGPAHLSLA